MRDVALDDCRDYDCEVVVIHVVIECANCEDSDSAESVSELNQKGWRVVDGKTYCKSCLKVISAIGMSFSNEII